VRSSRREAREVRHASPHPSRAPPPRVPPQPRPLALRPLTAATVFPGSLRIGRSRPPRMLLLLRPPIGRSCQFWNRSDRSFRGCSPLRAHKTARARACSPRRARAHPTACMCDDALECPRCREHFAAIAPPAVQHEE
jgi:hypothetical protein